MTYICACGCGTPVANPTSRYTTGHHNIARFRNWQERFWESVVVADGCWVWQGIRDRDGYGVFKSRRNGVRWGMRAHRLAYSIYHGPINEGLCVCHTCDNPSCVNPDHLFLGTDEDNRLDKIAKGRARGHGGNHPAAKLSDQAARDIRQRYARGGVSQRRLAMTFGVHQSVISKVIRREIWTRT